MNRKRKVEEKVEEESLAGQPVRQEKKQPRKSVRRLTPIVIMMASLYFSTNLDSQLKNINGDDVDSKQIRSIIIESWETEPWDIQAIPALLKG